jgi:hypothetical protein
MFISIHRRILSLYTIIPHEDAKQSTCILYCLQTNPDTYTQPEQPLPEVFAELTEIVLKNNVFEFNNDYYSQIQERHWVQKWHLHIIMQTYLWGNSKKN